MLNKIITLSISLCMTAFIFCQVLNIHKDDLILGYRVDPELYPYVTYFNNQFKEACPNKSLTGRYQIVFGVDPIIPEDPQVLGYCQQSVVGFRIVISNRFWGYANSQERFHLMVHEQAHCFIDKGHVDDITHYMYPSLMSMPNDLVQSQLLIDMKEYCDR